MILVSLLRSLRRLSQRSQGAGDLRLQEANDSRGVEPSGSIDPALDEVVDQCGHECRLILANSVIAIVDDMCF
jgi:hypothetical protein